ncbi:MAG: MBL fold metallo-hydrolase [Nocardiopsaceae bacterium]|jgi:ribonuclease BN (tRNA processing enzyme)|nr:MBL fold metallo-hydrolase [Nocardiopsaceae bacterium]
MDPVQPADPQVTVTFAGSGDAFGSGGRFQACIHVRSRGHVPFLLDCGATSLSALKTAGLDPNEIGVIFVSHLHGDHFGGLPFLILDAQFTRRTSPLTIAGPPGTAAKLREAMEALFPGSPGATRRFDVRVTELAPGTTEAVAGIPVTSWEVDHPSGAPPLALRVAVGGKVIAYTGDTAWTDDLVAVAADADLLIAEAYYFDKQVPYHLRHADIAAHRSELTSRAIVLTHLSADMLARDDQIVFDTAYDGLVVTP